MALEIVRERIGGIWKTVAKPSGGNGGSQPLADVLNAGDDADGQGIANLGSLTGPPSDHGLLMSSVESIEGFPGFGLFLKSLSEPSAQGVSIAGGSETGTSGSGGTVGLAGGQSKGAEGGGIISIAGGDAQDPGGYGGDATVTGGQADDGGNPGSIVTEGASEASPGSNGNVRIDCEAVILNGTAFGPAAHIAHGATIDQVIDALIAAGLMAAS